VRWSVALPTEQVERGPELISAEAISDMAGAIEAAGVDACHVTDHPYPPQSWISSGGHHSLDPLVALSFAAAEMTRAWIGAPGPDGNVLRPAPVSRPHPPIWFGGNSASAIRRVVASGQGWLPFLAPPRLAKAVRTAELADTGDLTRAIGELKAAVDRARRSDPIDICCVPFSHPHHRNRLEPGRLLEEADELAKLGVTWLSVRLPAPSRAGYLENVECFEAEVLTQLPNHRGRD
jgi:hypothetical protein